MACLVAKEAEGEREREDLLVVVPFSRALRPCLLTNDGTQKKPQRWKKDLDPDPGAAMEEVEDLRCC